MKDTHKPDSAKSGVEGRDDGADRVDQVAQGAPTEQHYAPVDLIDKDAGALREMMTIAISVGGDDDFVHDDGVC